MNFRHGMRKTRQYNTWNHMLSRCNNKNDPMWYNYGKRGIRVVKRWYKFINFWEDMKEGYFENSVIDRIDNYKGYSKKNCRWVTPQKSRDNKRNTIRIYFKGETKTLKEWCTCLGLVYQRTFQRLYKYKWPLEKSFSKESRSKRSY